VSLSADTRFEEHFPITVMLSHHTGLEGINAGIAKLLSGLRTQYLTDKQENEALSGTITTYGGYQTSKKMMFLNRPETDVQALRDQVVQPGVQAYLDRVFGEQGKQIKTRLVSWANILKEGDWQAPHMHPSTGNLITRNSIFANFGPGIGSSSYLNDAPPDADGICLDVHPGPHRVQPAFQRRQLALSVSRHSDR